MGLTSEQVARKEKEGLVNHKLESMSKSNLQIVKENVLTLFNLLNLMIAICLALVGAWSNLLFFAIIVANVLIGIIQEIHAKKLVDDLSLLIVPEATVIRDGKQQKVSVNHLVQEDVVVLTAGEQITCDAKVIEGQIEVNEAMLTGESDSIDKEVGDELFSGSHVISGKCLARIIHVGADNYAAKIALEAQKWNGIKSELLESIKKVTKITCFMIIPLGAVLFFEAFVLRQNAIDESVISSAAGLLGMLPKGLVLLISMSLAAGTIRLSKKRILVQQLFALETLAHVDTLCLDKTGTLTTGKMTVSEHHEYLEDDSNVRPYLQSFFYHSDDNNATFQALSEYFGKENYATPINKIAFSSAHKWSAIEFDQFSIVVGAPEKLLKEIPEHIMSQITSGRRVIVIGRTSQKLDKNVDLPEIEPLYIVVLNDILRKDVTSVLDKLYKENINIKIISGDHVNAVSAIAQNAGVKHYDHYIDLSTIDESTADFKQLVEKYTVFGRVTPSQKKKIVNALQDLGHVVGMTGDGVNDILALKDADCSIAIAEGSDAVKQVSQIVLLDSEFTSLPDVLFEGRRVVNHITRVAGVFFIKTIYSILVSLLCVAVNAPFPFIPIQITLIDLFVEGYPAFLTMLEPRYEASHRQFLSTALSKAYPKALSVTLAIISLMSVQSIQNINPEHMQTMMYGCVAIISMVAVFESCAKLNKFRLAVCLSMVLFYVGSIVVFHSLFHVTAITLFEMLLMISITIVSMVIGQILGQLTWKKFVK